MSERVNCRLELVTVAAEWYWTCCHCSREIPQPRIDFNEFAGAYGQLQAELEKDSECPKLAVVVFLERCLEITY